MKIDSPTTSCPTCERNMHHFMVKAVRRARPLMVGIIGTAIVLAGLVASLLPVPGLPLILAGLAILATEFVWARTLLASAKNTIVKIKERLSSLMPRS